MTAIQTGPARQEVVRLGFDFGTYELELAECRELARSLRRADEEPAEERAVACADRLDAVLDGRVEPGSRSGITEEHLDPLADAAWEWVRHVGHDGVSERVLTLLDVLRARHVHE
jgi:hypothetical protein